MGQEFSVWTSECHDSPHESRTFDSLRATRRLLCNWADRLVLRDEIMAWPPIGYPHSPLALAIPRSVSVVPHGKPGVVTVDDYEIMSYEHGLVTIEYETPRAEHPQSDPASPTDVVSEIIEPTVEFAQLPYTKFYWVGSSPPVYLSADEAPGLQIGGMEYSLTRHQLSSVPSAVLGLAGRVNQADFVTKLLGLAFAAETLLLRQPRVEIVTNSAGAQRFTLSYRLSYNVMTWNKFPRYRTDQASPTWEYLAIKDGPGTPYKPYPPGDFSIL